MAFQGFPGFSQKDFETFQIDGLEDRMDAIRERIQPKFQEIGDYLTEELSMKLRKEMHLHIAQHARRSKNPPNDTWLGIADDKRGYKKHPHFQVGLFDDHVFLWLAFIYELPHKSEIAKSFLENRNKIERLPKKFVISPDHMNKNAYTLKDTQGEDLVEVLERFRDVKKGEFLIGRHIMHDDPLLQDGEAFLLEAKKTFEKLIPLYRLSLKA
ncbi:YktB family protein [Alteribacillus sp. HJP-4]|uniref:YktB family protein n=1 Tax=Alteribacillus sp. HJP-4 TaxID=2775394 RepID=UPI0035CD396E